ncbi:MAG TPA: hypothetical protein VMG08_16810 [Allosphingosinicella sp.]|nr:hypothetical protein [Allosphingosinicella sp.]
MMADDNDDEHPTSASRPASDKTKDGTRNKRLLTGAAIGIGSAALVAALLYANRRRNDGT